MLQFCKNRLKIEQNCRTLSLISVQNYMQNLDKILVSKLGNHQRAQVSLLSNHFLIDRLSSVANFSCNAANDVDCTCWLQQEKSDQIYLMVQHSSEEKYFLMARWTSSGLSFFPVVSPFSNALKRKDFWAALNQNVDLIGRPHPCWRNNRITAPNALEAETVGKDVTNEKESSCHNHLISKWFSHIVKRQGSFWYRVNSFDNVAFQLIKCLKCCRAMDNSAKIKITQLAIIVLFMLSLLCEFTIFGFSSCRLNIICTFGEMSHHF